jgi:hypothetical protein
MVAGSADSMAAAAFMAVAAFMVAVEDITDNDVRHPIGDFGIPQKIRK